MITEKGEDITNFPSKGDNKSISLRNSEHPQFDHSYASKLKEDYPDIWSKGGNIRGNEAFGYWGKARDGSDSEGVIDWIKEREAWAARHKDNFRLAGVIAQIKWGVIGSKGSKYMKELVNKEKKKHMSKLIHQIDVQSVIETINDKSPSLVNDMVTYHDGFKSRYGIDLDSLSKKVSQTGLNIQAALYLCTIKKELSDTTKGIASALCVSIDEGLWNLMGFLAMIQREVGDYSIISTISQVISSIISLRNISAFIGDKEFSHHSYIYNSVEQPNSWDVERANDLVKLLNTFCQMTITLIESFGSEPGETYASCLNDLKTVYMSIEEFKPTLTNLLRYADEKNLMWLTERNRPTEYPSSMPELEITKKKALDEWDKWTKKFDIKSVRSIKGHKIFRGIATGVVIQPGDPDNTDLHGDWMSAEAIEEAMINYMVNSQVLGINHVEFSEKQGIHHPDYVCIENWITKCDQVIGGDFIKKGTWMRTIIAVSDRGRELLETRQLNGFSPAGLAYVRPAQKERSSNDD